MRDKYGVELHKMRKYFNENCDKLSRNDLVKQMQDAVDVENYEKAAILRDMIGCTKKPITKP